MLYTEVLKNNKDFTNLYRKGKSLVSKNIVVYFRTNRLPYNRFGITAGKKVGNAVMRNRAKRVIRQAYRENEVLFPVGIDIIFVARKAAAEVKADQLSSYVRKSIVTAVNSFMAQEEQI